MTSLSSRSLGFRYVKLREVRGLSQCQGTSKSLDFEKRKREVKPFTEIPRIPSLPLIGSLWSSLPYVGRYDLRRARDSAIKMYSDYGPIVREDISWSKHRVHIFNPTDVKEVFKHEGKYPRRELLDSLKNYAIDNSDKFSHVGLLNADNEEWHDLRLKVQLALKNKHIISHLSKLDQVSMELCRNIITLRHSTNKRVPNFADQLNKWALESLALFVLGTNLGCLRPNSNPEADQLLANVNEMFDLMYKLEFGYFQLWRWIRTPTYARFHKVLSNVTSVAQKYLEETKLRMKLNQETTCDNEIGFVQNLLLQGTDEKIILVAIHDMLLAGIDSTSTTVAFFLYHMARNPKHQERLADELKSLISTLDSPIPNDYLRRIPFLKICLKESIRLNQASRSIQRILTQDSVIRGYEIPAGTQVVLQTAAGCRLEENFENQSCFKPERWNDKANKQPFVYLPFGLGPRSCVGRKLSEQEIYTALIRIFRNFRVEYHYEDIDSHTKFVNFPNQPLKFEFYDI